MSNTIRRDYIPFTQVSNDLITAPGLSASAKVVYMTIAMHADNATQSAFPGITRLTRECGMSRNTVIKAIKQLETQGWLEVTREKSPAGVNEVNHYYVKNCPGSASSTPEGSSTTALDGSAKYAPELYSSSELDSSSNLDKQSGASRIPSHVVQDLPPETTDAATYAIEFDEAWAQYPKKRERKAAYRAYVARRRHGVSAQDLLRATITYAALQEGKDPQYIKNASTFWGPNEPFLDYLGPTEDVCPAYCPQCGSAVLDNRCYSCGWEFKREDEAV